MTSSYAARLAEHGVAPGGRVVLWLPRGCTFVVAALAVMKAGAAYIPVDIRQPARRFAVIVDDAQPILAIVGQGTPSLEDIGISTFEIDLDDPATGEGAPPMSGDDGRLAYIMYTSGSTGRPNGVPITHRALLNYLLWAADAYRLHEGTGSIAHTSVGFDLTVTTMWAPLLVGQRVRLVEEGAGLDALVRVMRSELDITLLKVTPSQLNALLDVVGQQELTRRVRTLVLGGEALRGEAIAALRGITTMRIVNEYGPTETVVGCSAIWSVTQPWTRGQSRSGRRWRVPTSMS
jgi:non-ribosomal peptide synthetase component F